MIASLTRPAEAINVDTGAIAAAGAQYVPPAAASNTFTLALARDAAGGPASPRVPSHHINVSDIHNGGFAEGTTGSSTQQSGLRQRTPRSPASSHEGVPPGRNSAFGSVVSQMTDSHAPATSQMTDSNNLHLCEPPLEGFQVDRD